MDTDETDKIDLLTVEAIKVLIEFKKNKITYKEAKKKFKFFTGLSDEITQSFISKMAKQDNINNIINFPERRKKK